MQHPRVEAPPDLVAQGGKAARSNTLGGRAADLNVQGSVTTKSIEESDIAMETS